ncbi:MAG: LapA family protein [Betaproteobacteria bacterium]|jgi:uncharacterized integral membrane protein
MRLPSLLLLVALILVLTFAVANWSVIIAPTSVSLLVADVQAPLGLIMLGIILAVTALFLAFAVYLQTRTLLDSRRHSREMHEQRELADKAESSRFTELRGFLEVELSKLREQVAESRTSVIGRVEQAEKGLHTTIEQSGNSLSAYIGELEDRLQSGAGGRGQS